MGIGIGLFCCSSKAKGTGERTRQILFSEVILQGAEKFYQQWANLKAVIAKIQLRFIFQGISNLWHTVSVSKRESVTVRVNLQELTLVHGLNSINKGNKLFSYSLPRPILDIYRVRFLPIFLKLSISSQNHKGCPGRMQLVVYTWLYTHLISK